MTYMTYRCHQLTLSDRTESLIHQTDHSIDRVKFEINLEKFISFVALVGHDESNF
jgi:hypothetical protein